MPQAMIVYSGQKAKVGCDGNCQKAWGVVCRPSEQLSEDIDDTLIVSDNDFDQAPTDPGTYEGGHGKPLSAVEFPNKWCVRQCERCAMVEPEQPLILPDWSQRVYNMPWLHNS